MQVVFRTSLGSQDAKKFELDHTKCQLGMSLDVKDATAEALKTGGIAVSQEDAKKDELIQSALGVSKEDFEKGNLRTVAKKPEVTAPAKA